MQLSRTIPIGQIIRPTAGWLRTTRDLLGFTLTNLAQRLKVTPPAIRSFEQAEAEDRITLASLRRVAAAMDCELIYALVPRTGAALPPVEASPRTRRGSLHAAAPSPEIPVAQDPSAKVTDLTWHTLHGDS